MDTTLLALDAGTTGVTAVLFDRNLFPLVRAYREFPQHFPRPGEVEHHADEIRAATDAVLTELAGHPRLQDVVGLGISNQRETVFALERATGMALGPGIVWQDRRTAARCRELAPQAELVRRKTGLPLDPYFSATKIEWMLRADPALERRAQAGEVVFATVDALLVAHLTGGAQLATEPTNASRTLLYDIDRKAWDDELCGLFGLQATWLPEVLPSISPFGSTRGDGPLAREVPILGMAGDQQAALYGQGCFEPGSSKATFGTGSFLLLNTGSQRIDSKTGLVTTLAARRDGSPCYALEGSVFVCGALVQWLRDELGFVHEAAEIEALARQVEDAGGVHVVPAFAGLGAPYWDADARGAILGLTRGSTKAHIARAALEALAFQNADVIECFRTAAPFAVEELLVDGGAASNDLLMQLQADYAGLRVRRPADVEATARGAAALAGRGAGVWDDPGSAQALQGSSQAFDPRLDPAQREAALAGWATAVQRVRT